MFPKSEVPERRANKSSRRTPDKPRNGEVLLFEFIGIFRAQTWPLLYRLKVSRLSRFGLRG